MHLKSEKLSNNAVLFIIAYSIMPIVSRAVSSYMTTYAYMAFSVFFLVLILLERKMDSLDEYFYYAIPFLLYGLLTYTTNNMEIVLWGYRFVLFLMPIITGIYVISYRKKDCKIYAKVIIFCVIITCATTIRGLKLYPEASRWLATVGDSQGELVTRLSWMNIGGYELVYTVVLLYPLLVLAYKKNKINLTKTLILAAMAFFCLLLADYTISLLLFVVTSTMFFTKRELKFSDVVIFFVVAVLLIIIFGTFVSKILQNIAGSVDSENLSARLNDLAGGTQGLQRSEDNRLELYMISLNSFFRYPLGAFATKKWAAVGGHSFILDFMGQYGIPGVIVLIYMYRNLYCLFYKKYKNEESFGYIAWIFAQAVLLSTINTGMWVDILAFYAPVILHMMYGGDENEKNSLGSKCIT